jgi:hypothetical protein
MKHNTDAWVERPVAAHRDNPPPDATTVPSHAQLFQSTDTAVINIQPSQKAGKQRAATTVLHGRHTGGFGCRMRHSQVVASPFEEGGSVVSRPVGKAPRPLDLTRTARRAAGAGRNAARGGSVPLRNVAPAMPWTAFVPRFVEPALAGSEPTGRRPRRPRPNPSLPRDSDPTPTRRVLGLDVGRPPPLLARRDCAPPMFIE